MSAELLSPRDLALVDAVAQRVLELLDERREPNRLSGAETVTTSLVDASTLAGLLGVSRSTVYEHAAELGAVQVGNGAKPRLRFDIDGAREAWTRRDTSERSQPPQPPAPAGAVRRRRRAATRNESELLPVRGDKCDTRA